MSACTTSLSPPYGYYVRLLFAKGQSTEKDLVLSQQNKNFRSGGKGMLHYLGWQKTILGAEYQRVSKYSSQGRSWPTGIPYTAPQVWDAQLILNPVEWSLLQDMYVLQQASMKPDQAEKDILVYDHRIMHREATPILRPEFDSVGAIATSGTYQYWAVFRGELVKIDLVGMSVKPSDGAFQYLADVQIKERLPVLAALP
jgi:hypothetical protein